MGVLLVNEVRELVVMVGVEYMSEVELTEGYDMVR